MANILQVTTPNLNAENRNILNTQDPRQGANQAVRNPVDPTRVVRADGRDGQQAGNTTKDAAFNVIEYESNYGAFIKKLGEDGQLANALERLLFAGAAGLQGAEKAEVGALIEKFLMSVRMDSPQELLEFMQGQNDLQARFGGAFFDKLRAMMAQNGSDSLKEAALYFLKGYNDYSSGAHLLQQMRTLMGDIELLLLRSYQNEFRELADSMDWNAANGDTALNAAILNSRLIPFLSSYISRVHDFGAVRDAAMLLIFHAVRYEGGNEDYLRKLFENMMNNRDFGRLFKGDPQAELENLLRDGAKDAPRPMSDFADGLANLLLKGANGRAGLENVQQFYSIMNGLLVNESVYMPLLHLVIPFQYEEHDVVSEMWVDPDAKKDSEDESRKIKVFLKFDIQNLGKFELTMILQDHETRMHLLVPPNLAKQNKKIETAVGEILNKNGIRFSQLMVRERLRDRRVDEVFPEIREKERTINVRI